MIKKHHNYEWQKLDNVAILYSAITTYNNPNLYRVSIKLKELIDQETLIKALNITLTMIPSFKVKLKRGLFWYYFEKNNANPIVKKEEGFAYYRVDTYENNDFLFNVTYYEKKINIDISHMLADGSGSLNFLTAIVYNYLKIKHPLKITKDLVLDLELLSKNEMKVDSFIQCLEENTKSEVTLEKSPRLSYQIPGIKLNKDELNVIAGIVPLSDIKKLAKEKEVSLTAYLTAIFIQSIYEEKYKYDKKNLPITVCIPVNLRNYFKSTTMNNFFTSINVSVNYFNRHYSFDELLKIISTKLKQELEPNILIKKFKGYVSFQKNIFARFVPLFIKEIILKMSVEIVGKNNVTSTVSNVGSITLPSVLNSFVDKLEIVTYPDRYLPLKIGICSFDNKLSITFPFAIADKEIARYFFKFLSKKGIEVSISSSLAETKDKQKNINEGDKNEIL
ncbi:MAG: hypothetical protein PHQ89_01335 [Bacilli bacterium]|nr:hypothetical protein [Bacilli bacterium]